jgi:bile acid:Na+ symporter, BASS family
MLHFRRICLALAAIALLALLAGLALNRPALWQPAALVGTAGLAIGLGALPALASYQFTAWILVTVVAALLYPQGVIHWGDVDLTNKWIRLIAIQAVMFGMGTQMGLRDFAGVLRNPWGVFVAVFSQFTVMPLVGWGLTKIFPMEPEIAAGVILIGACSSGLASNVMCYIAKANLPLSVTATACTTMLAPIMTPLWMKILAGTLVKISFVGMMTEIIKIVLVPIGAGLIHDYLKWASPRGRAITHALAAASAVGALVLIFGWSKITTGLSPDAILLLELLGFLLGAVAGGVLYHRLTLLMPWLDRWMPVVSMLGIMYFTSVTTAVGRDNLLRIGGVLFLVAALHNGLGYVLGYWLGRAGGLDKNSARTVAIEVGLQNGGMASGLAGSMGKLATVGLAAAVFGTWMNISGSILANYWRRKPVADGSGGPPAEAPGKKSPAPAHA